MDTSKSDVNKFILEFSIKLLCFTLCQAYTLEEVKSHYVFQPSDIQEIVGRSCFVGVPTGRILDGISDKSKQEHVDIYSDLKQTFHREENVIIGLTDISDFTWPSGKPLKYMEDVSNDETSFSLLVFPKTVRDRTCLSVGKLDRLEQKPYIYNGILVTDIMIEFVNNKCNTFRNRQGYLNINGLHRQEILSSLFHVRNISDITTEHLIQTFSSSQGHCTKDNCDHVHQDDALLGSHHTNDDRKKLLNLKYIESVLPKCDKIDLPSKEFFFHDYLKISKPVIIKNALDNWAALTKWTNEFFKQEHGSRKVHLKLTPSGEFEGVDSAKNFRNYETFHIPADVRQQLLFPDLVVVRPATINMNMSEFIDVIESVSSGERKGFSAYLEYSSIADIMPDLGDDIKEMPFFTNLLKLKHRNVWLSDGNTLGKLHFDPFDNFLCQLSGRKQVILYDPHNNEQLYEAHIPEAMLHYHKTNQTFSKYQLVDSTSMVMSPVDLQNPDLKRFPLFGQTYPLNCTIEEGEVLFMPAFWWHEVQSYPNTDQRRNLAVNFWYEPFLQKEFPCQECRLDVNPNYRHLL